MKKIVFLLLCVCSMSFAIPRSVYLIKVEDHKNTFDLNVVKPQQPSRCQLVMTEFSITLPLSGQEGVFSVRVEKNSQSPALMAIGAHKGSFSFTKGNALPQIPDGVYRFVLNGVDFGYLTVQDDAVSFQYKDLNDIVFPPEFQ